MIAIIDYGAGNPGSVYNAVSRLGYNCMITNNVDTICAADKLILPGVGEAGSAMEQLRRNGLADIIPTLEMPFLGICLGLQLLCTYSEESETTCLGIFDTRVSKFSQREIVPHMGWNSLGGMKGKLFESVMPENADVYFVHSFFAEPCASTIALCNYNYPFSAALQHNNFYATQFHPEKSGAVGEMILKNFLSL